MYILVRPASKQQQHQHQRQRQQEQQHSQWYTHNTARKTILISHEGALFLLVHHAAYNAKII